MNEDAKADWIDDKCPRCNGTGVSAEKALTPPDNAVVSATPCPACGGMGRKRKSA